MSNDKYRTPEERLYYQGQRKPKLTPYQLGKMLTLSIFDRASEGFGLNLNADECKAVAAFLMEKGIGPEQVPVKRAKSRPLPVYNRHPYGEEETE